MKKIGLILVCVVAGFTMKAQPGVVAWQFSVKKITEQSYELHLTAAIQPGWSIYSQTTPDGGPRPTVFSFNKNPLLALEGNVQEQGTMKKKHEELFGVDVHYFKDKVDFVQVVTFRRAQGIKTSISGQLEYMACNEQQCLPPKTVPFTIQLN